MPYMPDKSKSASVVDTRSASGSSFAPQPKMYGGAAQALNSANYDWANNGIGGLEKPPK